MDAVYVLDVVLVEAFHEQRASFGLGRRKQQMQMIRHQAIRVHRAPRVARKRLEVSQVSEAVPVAKETVASIVPTLNDMECHTREDVSGTSRHTEKTSEPPPELTGKWVRPYFSLMRTGNERKPRKRMR